MHEPDAKPDLPEVFACFLCITLCVCVCVAVCMHADVCVYVQGSHLMGFVEVSGSYQNGKGSNTEIDQISVFRVFS